VLDLGEIVTAAGQPVMAIGSSQAINRFLVHVTVNVLVEEWERGAGLFSDVPRIERLYVIGRVAIMGERVGMRESARYDCEHQDKRQQKFTHSRPHSWR